MMNRREFLALAAAPLVLGALPAAARARGMGGTPVALVTADTQARVLAVEIGTRRVVRTIRTLPWPRSIESLHGLAGALVAHTEEGAVTLMDGLRVRRVLEGLAEPRYTALPPGGSGAWNDGLAYVTDSGRGELVTLDVGRARIVHRLDLGGPARHVTTDGLRLWAALGSKASEIAVVGLERPRRPRLLGTLRPPWLAHDVAVAPGGATVWVTSGDRSEIALFPPGAVTPRRVLPAGAPPQHVAFRDWGAAAGVAYVTSGADGTLRTHGPDGRLLRAARVPVGSYNVTCSGSWVVSPSLDVGTLAVLDAAGEPVARVRLAPAAHDACVLVL
jgi:hypothetical protein